MLIIEFLKFLTKGFHYDFHRIFLFAEIIGTGAVSLLAAQLKGHYVCTGIVFLII